MSEATERLERLLADELGECRDDDLTNRLAELDDLGETALPGDAYRDTRAFAALSNETRYRIVRLLIAAEDDLCVCELTPLLDVSDSAVSHALSELAEAGLVSRRREGRWAYYDSTERTEALLDALDATAPDR